MSIDQRNVNKVVNKIFFKYDSDKNNVLDKEEVAKLLTEQYAHLGRGPSTLSEAHQFLKRYDTNKDGVISRQELKQMLTSAALQQLKSQ